MMMCFAGAAVHLLDGRRMMILEGETKHTASVMHDGFAKIRFYHESTCDQFTCSTLSQRALCRPWPTSACYTKSLSKLCRDYIPEWEGGGLRVGMQRKEEGREEARAGVLSLTSAVYAVRRHVYRRYLIFVFSLTARSLGHTPALLYINQYECLTVSPSAARHHVLVFPCLARQRASFDARSPRSILVCGGNWLRSSSPNHSNFRMSRTP